MAKIVSNANDNNINFHDQRKKIVYIFILADKYKSYYTCGEGSCIVKIPCKQEAF